METLLTALPILPISQAKDFVRLHPNEEEYWSEELCFAIVPTKGTRDTLHLIDEDLATQYLDSANHTHLIEIEAIRQRQDDRSVSPVC